MPVPLNLEMTPAEGKARALDALPDPLLRFDAADTLREAGRAAAREVGRSPDQLTGLSRAEWQALWAEHCRPREVPEEWETRRYPRRVFRREVYPLRGAEGTEGAESAEGLEGAGVGTLEYYRDITEVARLREEGERAAARHGRESEALVARLEQIEKLKLELTANVTHDLRTPLASIKAAVSGLLAGDVTYDPAEMRETLVLIDEETDRLQRRVQNLLSMARMESGDAILSRSWSDVPDLVGSALESLRSLRGDRAVSLDLPADLPLVNVDYDQVQIAIRNLVENAFLYSPPDRSVEVSARMGLGQLRLRVRDYGGGLMPDEFERVFDKFYRGRAARRIPGTGLGLPICRGIAEAHGGRLWAEHVPGGGVAFVLSLPLEEPPAECGLTMEAGTTEPDRPDGRDGGQQR